MKGNEARVVFFLHAVEKFKEGRVKKEEGLVEEELVIMEEGLERKEGVQRGKSSKRKKREGDFVEKKRKIEKDNDDKHEQEDLLLHTEPYYLAITRSCCEVTSISHYS